jgi:hypothetical protein
MNLLPGHLSELLIAAEITEYSVATVAGYSVATVVGYSVATVAVRVQCCYSCWLQQFSATSRRKPEIA